MDKANKTRRNVDTEKPVEWENSEGVKPEQAEGTFVPEDTKKQQSNRLFVQVKGGKK